MYILNADNDMKKQWYKCSRKLGVYLLEKRGIPVIHIDEDDKFYFPMTDRLNLALKNLPLIHRIFK